ncbi:hypothetical protein AQUCO_05200050v1 [Aquilegia coerulea]|uniref:Uncharacterized protein n=1 Tax=Aquilegia coerulea TaxID=218851 RepID=A0A2G5CIS3_AQUCA|nr:hypothetical protein AQUCO_05200050v1 [Aquilegia coerulea]
MHPLFSNISLQNEICFIILVILIKGIDGNQIQLTPQPVKQTAEPFSSEKLYLVGVRIGAKGIHDRILRNPTNSLP